MLEMYDDSRSPNIEELASRTGAREECMDISNQRVIINTSDASPVVPTRILFRCSVIVTENKVPRKFHSPSMLRNPKRRPTAQTNSVPYIQFREFSFGGSSNFLHQYSMIGATFDMAYWEALLELSLEARWGQPNYRAFDWQTKTDSVPIKTCTKLRR